MSHFDPDAYGPHFAPLLTERPLMELGPGRPVESARRALEGFDLDAAFEGAIRDRSMARCCLSGLWLAYDFLDESHRISQEIDTATGSYWHGIMHRREPDPGNSGYWFRKVGRHPVFEPLGRAIATHHAALLRDAAWDPFAFIQMCETGRKQGGAQADLCREAQAIEWQILFDYCHAHAKGR